MADDVLSIGAIGDVAAGSTGTRVGTAHPTGSLRRKYNFGDRVSELNIAQDPFFRFVSKLAKKPTDDPSFKFTERRPSFHKRYGYPIAYSNDNITWNADYTSTVATQGDNLETAGNTTYVKMAADYYASGNITNVYGQSGTEIVVGADGTQSEFYMPNQLIKVNWSTSSGGGVKTYAILKVDTVTLQTYSAVTNHTTVDAVILKCTVIKAKDAAVGGTDTNFPAGMSVADFAGDSTYSIAQADLEPYRAYVIGSAHDPGTGFPETWDDQPFSTAYGQTQIWKTAMAMNNTDRATILKYEPNEWARVWKEKLIEHKWDIETSLLFGSQTSATVNTTEGAVNFITGYGNVFSLDIATKTQDDFLDDMSAFLDPRYNNANATLFFVNTAVYNWLHKLSGYFSNNLEISPNFRADMALTGKKKVFGVDITTISTPFGDMNVVRNIHLDSSNIKILAVNMKHCAYRPLVGNGLNRDTAVYVGVQTLENTGVDRRVDLIQTEAGMEWQMPESHAYWS